jgi:hypothetical protein
MIGIIGWSYALEDDEPSLSNRALSDAEKQIQNRLKAQARDFRAVNQWEVALGGCHTDFTVLPFRDRYLNSRHVIEEAAPYLRSYGVTQVIPVAKPGLHLTLVKRLIKEFGFTPEVMDLGKVPYNAASKQWWTRGVLQEYSFAVLRQLHLMGEGAYAPTPQMLHFAAQRPAAP